MMGHDLISFPGTRISLTSIHGIENDMDLEGKPTGMVIINYGQGYRIGFEGDVDSVMEIIDAYCIEQRAPGLEMLAAEVRRI
jgi:hypothetical protein